MKEKKPKRQFYLVGVLLVSSIFLFLFNWTLSAKSTSQSSSVAAKVPQDEDLLLVINELTHQLEKCRHPNQIHSQVEDDREVGEIRGTIVKGTEEGRGGEKEPERVTGGKGKVEGVTGGQAVRPTLSKVQPGVRRIPTGRFLYMKTGKHGVGHTVAEYNWGVVEAQRHNLQRIHIPLVCAHGPEADCEIFFAPETKEDFTVEEIDFAIAQGQLKSIRIPGPTTSEKFAEYVRNYTETNLVFDCEETRSNSDYRSTRAWWVSRLQEAKKDPLWHEKFLAPGFDREKINVALHIRRGDLVKSFGKAGKEKLTQIRFTPNEFYIRAFKAILRLFPEGLVAGHFVSQGEAEEFADIIEAFPTHRVSYDGAVLDDFRLLMESDILVTAKSGFSHLAATLSESTVIALPFWGTYNYLESVVVADEANKDGFDVVRFVRVWNRRAPEMRKWTTATIGLQDDFEDPLHQASAAGEQASEEEATSKEAPKEQAEAEEEEEDPAE